MKKRWRRVAAVIEDNEKRVEKIRLKREMGGKGIISTKYKLFPSEIKCGRSHYFTTFSQILH